jgi:hypothetical protein
MQIIFYKALADGTQPYCTETFSKMKKCVTVCRNHVFKNCQRCQPATHLNSKFEVFSLIKPGAGVWNIVDSSIRNLIHLTKNDVIVLSGGSNDVNKVNKNVALSKIIKFIQFNGSTNMIILGITHRHDLPCHYSAINTEICVISRKLIKIIKNFEHKWSLECDSQRAVYTHQGLHLNALGKEMISKQIALLFYKSVGNKEEPPIFLKWNAVQTECIVTTVPCTQPT